MEKPLILRKPSHKPLLMLLNVAEELLFSYPIPEELVSKYEKMRTKVFSKLKIIQSSLPLSSELNTNQSSKKLILHQTSLMDSEKIIKLELFSLLQTSQNITESYSQALSANILTLKNICNDSAEISQKGQKFSKNIEGDKILNFDDEFLIDDDSKKIEFFKKNFRDLRLQLKEKKDYIELCENNIHTNLKLLKAQINEKNLNEE